MREDTDPIFPYSGPYLETFHAVPVLMIKRSWFVLSNTLGSPSTQLLQNICLKPCDKCLKPCLDLLTLHKATYYYETASTFWASV